MLAACSAILLDMNHETLAQELVRALRGSRSQRAFSRWLGYRTNVLYTWESGRRWPTAAEALRAAARARVDLDAALRRYFPSPPAWLRDVDPASPEGVVALLGTLVGDATAAETARRSGLSPHSVGRWLRGDTQPRLPDFLRLIDATSLRLLDFIAVLVDPARLPSAAGPWADLVARRRLAGERPWTQAVLRVLELTDYRSLKGHRDGWIAQRLGIGIEEERACLDALASSGAVHWDGRRYVLDEVVALDTRLDAHAGRQSRIHWSEVAQERVREGRPGQFSFNVFAVSLADFERVREMHLAYFRAIRPVIAASRPCERVAVANVQLFLLDDDAGSGASH